MSTYSYEGMEREYTLYRPSNLKENSPLVVFLHWYTGSAKEIIDIIGFNDIADKYGFAVLYPEGLLDKYGNKHWNSGLQLSEVDDIGFITALIKSLQEKYILDKHNTFVTGISNGGFMTYSLALHKPELFNAFAPVIGTMSGKDWNERTFKYPVPILHICGLDDEVVPFDGTGSLEDGWGGREQDDIRTGIEALIEADVADRLNAARAGGNRVIAVGTTSLRLLESAAGEDRVIRPFAGDTAIFITPGYRFRAIDGLMTNFHLPRSTLFMLVSALMGRETMQAAYAHAIANEYRFYSYGDSSLLLP